MYFVCVTNVDLAAVLALLSAKCPCSNAHALIQSLNAQQTTMQYTLMKTLANPGLLSTNFNISCSFTRTELHEISLSPEHKITH